MSAPSFILLPGSTTWRVGVVRAEETSFTAVVVPQNLSHSQLAGLVVAALNNVGYAGQGTILAVPSAWCFAASIRTDDLPRNDRKAMLFRLEEKMPDAAESLIADFLPQREGSSRAMGVCIRSKTVAPLVTALESAGIAVQSITPAMLLAVQGIEAGASAGCHALLCPELEGSEASLNLFVIADGIPTGWALLPPNGADVKLALEIAALGDDPPVTMEACEVSAEFTSALSQSIGQTITTRAVDVSKSAAQISDAIATGRQEPWIEFRRGPLAVRDSLAMYRKPLNAVLAAAVIFLAICAGVTFLRAERYSRAASETDQKLAAAFHKKFPNWTTPGNVRAIVDAEYRKLGHRADDGSLPEDVHRSALTILHDVLAQLPANTRFRIDRISVLDSSFSMEGKLRSYEEADALAASARKAGLDVPAPQSRKDADGMWSFSIRGTRPSKSAGEVAKGTGE